MSKKSKIDIEKSEIDLLINKGMSFQVERITYKKQKGIFSIFRKRIPETESLTYVIHEPTLAVLDLIAKEQVELKIDENVMSSEAGISEGKKLPYDHARRMARIIALAVLGEDYIKAFPSGSRIKYEYDDRALDELTDILFMNLKPAKLVQLALMVNTIGNYADFANSIRLMSAARTTMPKLIEENQKG